MNSTRPAGTAHPFWAWFCIVIGLAPLAVAGGLVPVEASALQAPAWVLALCGLVFVIGGCMMLLGRNSRLNDLLAGVICLSFAAVGIRVALFGPSANFSGGIPLLSHEQNVTLGRWVIGCGAVVSLALAGCALWRARRRDGS